MYRTICTEFWTDPKVKSLSWDAKGLFMYLITNPHTHLSGIYYLPIVTMQHETGMTRRAIDGALKGLLASKMVQMDEMVEQIWVVKMFAYQGRGQKTEKGVASHLETLHKSTLLERFLEQYSTVKSHLSATFLDAPSMGDAVFPSPDPVPDSSSSEGEKIVKKRGNGHTEFPQDWKLSEEEKAIATALSLNPLQEFARFRDHHLSKGNKFKDWPAAWRNWARKSVEFKEGKA